MCLAIPGKLETVAGDDPFLRSGRVNFGGVTRDVSLACLPDAQPGDYVLVHVGMAIGKVDEAEANKIFGYLREMNDLADLEDAALPVGDVPPPFPAVLPASGGVPPASAAVAPPAAAVPQGSPPSFPP